MKLSELIAKLTEIQRVEGDLPVYLPYDHVVNAMDDDSVWVAEADERGEHDEGGPLPRRVEIA